MPRGVPALLEHGPDVNTIVGAICCALFAFLFGGAYLGFLVQFATDLVNEYRARHGATRAVATASRAPPSFGGPGSDGVLDVPLRRESSSSSDESEVKWAIELETHLDGWPDDTNVFPLKVVAAAGPAGARPGVPKAS